MFNPLYISMVYQLRLFLYIRGLGRDPFWHLFMYKVYINRLIETVCNSKCALVIDKLRTGSPTFDDDMTLLSLFPSCLQLLMQKVTQYSKIW